MSKVFQVSEDLLKKVRIGLDKAIDRAKTSDVYELEEMVEEIDKLISSTANPMATKREY